MKLMSVKEAAEVVGVSVDHLRRFISRGELACVKLGRRVLVEHADLEIFVAAHREPAMVEADMTELGSEEGLLGDEGR